MPHTGKWVRRQVWRRTVACMIFVLLGAAVVLWGVAGFVLGLRVGQRRASTIVLQRPGSASLENTVVRMPESPRSWEEPDWSRSRPGDSPGTGRLPGHDSEL